MISKRQTQKRNFNTSIACSIVNDILPMIQIILKERRKVDEAYTQIAIAIFQQISKHNTLARKSQIISRCTIGTVDRIANSKNNTNNIKMLLNAYRPLLQYRRQQGRPFGEMLHKINMHYLMKGGEFLMKQNSGQTQRGIGNVLHSLRIIENLSVKELAERMGVTSSYICDVESNRKRPSLRRLKLYSVALGIELYNLIYLDEEHEKHQYSHRDLLYKILNELSDKSV